MRLVYAAHHLDRGVTAKGHEEWSPPARSSVGNRFNTLTLVGILGNARDAP